MIVNTMRVCTISIILLCALSSLGDNRVEQVSPGVGMLGMGQLTRVSYCKTELLIMNSPFNMLILPDVLREHIISLGIKRRFRGHRGRKSRIRRTGLWRANWDNNNKVNLQLLRPLPAVSTFDNNRQSKFGLVNARSIRNKANLLVHYAISENLDFCIVTET